MITSTVLMSKLANRKVGSNDVIGRIMTKEFRNMSSSMPLSELSRVLERQNFVFVDSAHVVSNQDLLNFMSDKL